MANKSIVSIAIVCSALTMGPHVGSGNQESLGVPLSFYQLWNSHGDTLSGLDGVYVVIFLDDDAEKVGLSKDDLKAQVELALEQFGVPTIQEEDFTSASILTKRLRDFVAGGYVAMKEAEYQSKMGDYGRLQFEITLTDNEYPIGSTVSLTLCQTGLLPSRLPDQVMVAPCITWLDAGSGVYGEKVVKERISGTTKALTHRFCRDYVAAHKDDSAVTNNR